MANMDNQEVKVHHIMLQEDITLIYRDTQVEMTENQSNMTQSDSNENN